MSDERIEAPTEGERRVLTRTSICQIAVERGAVSVQIGKVVLMLSPVELAALSGSCLRATRQLFPRRDRRRIPYLRLVTDDDEVEAVP